MRDHLFISHTFNFFNFCLVGFFFAFFGGGRAAAQFSMYVQLICTNVSKLHGQRALLSNPSKVAPLEKSICWMEIVKKKSSRNGEYTVLSGVIFVH